MSRIFTRKQSKSSVIPPETPGTSRGLIRRRSEEEESENKRGRTNCDNPDSLKFIFTKEGKTRGGAYSITPSQVNNSDLSIESDSESDIDFYSPEAKPPPTKTKKSPTMPGNENEKPTTVKADVNDDELTEKLMRVMVSDKVLNVWIQKLSDTIDKKITEKMTPIKADIDQMKAENTETNTAVKKFEEKLDMLEQRDRRNNLIFSGIPNSDNPKNAVTKMIKEKINQTFNGDEIDYAFHMARTRQVRQSDPIKVVFKSAITRDEIYKKRVQLATTTLFINEDLTPRKAQQHYQIRQDIKNKEGARTWTVDGKIFVKLPAKDKAVKIITDEDFTRMRELLTSLQ